MMKYFFSFLLCAFFASATAQYIGIGNTNPIHTLDISGRIRIRGGIDNNFSSGLWLAGVGLDSTSDKIFMGMRNDSTVGFYNGTGGWSFNVNGKNGNVGIGNQDPSYPLSFKNLSGDKISLYRDINSNYYGMGIGNSLLQLMTPHSTSDIVFGYGKSAAFTENMRIKGNGNVGIGITDPAYKLDVGGRMRIRATPGFTSGLWLNNEANTAIPAFIGMQANDQVGFFGSGTGWSFLMNTQTGAISVGGNVGAAGQVLASNGSGSAPSWQGGGGSKIFIARQSTNSISIRNDQTDIPDLVANFTLPVASKVLFQYSADVYVDNCFACTEKRVSIVLFQNVVGGTSEIDRVRASIGNDAYWTTLVSGPAVFDFPAGTYSFKVMFSCSGNTNTATAGFGKFSWQIFSN